MSPETQYIHRSSTDIYECSLGAQTSTTSMVQLHDAVSNRAFVVGCGTKTNQKSQVGPSAHIVGPQGLVASS